MSVVLILLSCGVSILTGILLDRSSPAGTANFRAVYYGARCLLNHGDPYDPADFLSVYMKESGELPTVPSKKQFFLRATMVCVNLPTTLFLVVPVAMLPWSLSHVLWLLLVAGSITVAALLAYDLAGEYASGPALLLICIMMANCEVLFATGNTAGIAVGLCVVAVWCFVRQRFQWLGILAMAVSLAIKPHDSGLVWLCLLLAGGVLRKRSLQVFALTALIAIPAILWLSSAAPDWSRELRANLAATSARGDISDPGPASISRKGSADVLIDLQTVVSVFDDNPRVYNPVVYAISGLLLLGWGFKLVRTAPSAGNTWYALAAIAPLAMLFSYHRPYDARLLLLAVPACSMLWAAGHTAGRIAVAVNVAAVLLTSDIPLAILTLLTGHVNIVSLGGVEKILMLPLLRPAPLALFLAAVVNLWVYMRRAGNASTPIIEFPRTAASSSRV
ncbi:MAG TPA: glycosyltransferase family 87 protein [Terracidiphilus sp.]|jgi:hypothetical protein